MLFASPLLLYWPGMFDEGDLQGYAKSWCFEDDVGGLRADLEPRRKEWVNANIVSIGDLWHVRCHAGYVLACEVF